MFRSSLPKMGLLLFSVKLLESRITARAAMKPAPAKSVLNGNLTTGNTADLANEMLNEQQRSRGGEVVQEDESRYLVTVRRTDAPGAWSGEVIGPPTLYPLTTVNVLTANKALLVLDKNNQLRWQSALTYNVNRGLASLEPEHAPYGLGPCVERQGTLYVYDEGVLAAFDLANGNVRWRLPSVGITGLFFDDQGMLYVNATTASPDAIKYSNQIDITRKASPVVMKVDPRTGKGLWTAQLGGLVNYVSGKFIYTMSRTRPTTRGTAPSRRTPSSAASPFCASSASIRGMAMSCGSTPINVSRWTFNSIRTPSGWSSSGKCRSCDSLRCSLI